MSSDQNFDSDETIFGGPKPDLPEEEKVLFFMDDDPESSLEIKSGDSLTIGRSIENDFLIENKTISRKHLVVRRTGNTIAIDVIGRNGIKMNNQVYFDQTVSCTPPVSFVIGEVDCSVEFEVDDDKTIIVLPDRQTGGGDQETGSDDTLQDAAKVSGIYPGSPTPEARTPEPQPYAGPSPEPFDPAPKDSFMEDGPGISTRQHQPDPPSYQAPKDPLGGPPRPQGQPPVPGHEQFEPVAAQKKFNFKLPKPSSGSFFSNRNNLIIAGAIVLVVLIAVVISVFVFSGDKTEPEETPRAASPSVKTESPSAGTQQSADYHKTLIDMAEELIRSGDPSTARDLLLDVPPASPYHAKAKKLMEQLPED